MWKDFFIIYFFLKRKIIIKMVSNNNDNMTRKYEHESFFYCSHNFIKSLVFVAYYDTIDFVLRQGNVWELIEKFIGILLTVKFEVDKNINLPFISKDMRKQ